VDGDAIIYKTTTRLRYISCSMAYRACGCVCGQDCPDGEDDDFRLVQCRDYFDGIPINGTSYTWVPYFPGNTCIQMTGLHVVCTDAAVQLDVECVNYAYYTNDHIYYARK